ncbi:c-type cytochrome [Aurantibacillus circumpalustris]|uniref:c-type cytochrome n=1 Tax=Aurantibacillus circumpalustris TaxID=3036359 RepID=UPI00295B8294|nr:c-type cytochrome [Aurantibacillus circumpalustris]
MKQYFILFINLLFLYSCDTRSNKVPAPKVLEKPLVEIYKAPDTSDLKDDEWGRQVKYGRRLIENTSYYIGPEGIVSKNLGNKMTCTNCHLNNGTKPFGLNFFNSHKTYPQYRARENAILTMSDRVNNCIERPHSGKPLKLDSKEMNAIVSYIKWVGEKYDPEKHQGYSLKYVDYERLQADPKRGEAVYLKQCKTCHQEDGQGEMNVEGTKYTYPPLWGLKSYQEGSSMHRVIKAASFIKYNMPDKIATLEKPVLTDQEALDVAAFINDGSIHPRPKAKPGHVDYANIKTKPIDYFKAPYLDGFSEKEHMFGPWDEIEKFYTDKGLKANK